MSSLKDKYAIVGVGDTKYGKHPGLSHYDLNVIAIKEALEDCGLTNKDVDCLLTKSPVSGFQWGYSSVVSELIGIEPNVTGTIEAMGATCGVMVQIAMGMIEAGLCKVAVLTYGDNPVTGVNPYGGVAWEKMWGDPGMFGMYGAPAKYSLFARRHMHQFGTKAEQFGAIKLACCKHALLNPKAQLQKEVTIEQYMNSPMIAEPVRAFDSCLVSDGGGAVIVTSAEMAKSLKKKPVYVMGCGQYARPQQEYSKLNLMEGPAKRSGEIAFKMAGITPKDIDVAQIYDCFTVTALITIEDYGFCKKGEGGPFVEGGRIELGGELPVNTGGGMLAECGLSGFQGIIEGVRQMRGECGPRQVKDAEIGLVDNEGGTMQTRSTLILRR
ncbi:thiolase family protein [Chloroflexota bacterium]